MACNLSIIGYFLALLLSSALLAKATLEQDGRAPYHREDGDLIESDYIVHLHENHTLELHQHFIGFNLSGNPSFQSISWLSCYRIVLDHDTLHNIVRTDPGVLLVEHNMRQRIVRPVEGSNSSHSPLIDDNTPSHEKRYYDGLNLRGAPANMIMISASGKVNNPGSYDEYTTFRNAGSGVRIYIMDTGININHRLFKRLGGTGEGGGSRAENFQGLSNSPYTDDPNDDVDGHGTHVASTAGAVQFGVAEYSTLVNVKICGSDGYCHLSAQAQAIGDIVSEHQINRAQDQSGLYRGAVINMSLGGIGSNQMVRRAVARAIAAGIPVVAAAGNEGDDASEFYPCSYDDVICVGAVDYNYDMTYFSNYGPSVKIFGPGSDIEGADSSNNEDVRELSGTSQATPHISGILAIFISWEAICNNAPLAIQRLYSNAIPNILSSLKPNTANLFGISGIRSPYQDSRSPYYRAPFSPAYKCTSSSGAQADEPVATPVSDPNTSAMTTIEIAAIITPDPVITDGAPLEDPTVTGGYINAILPTATVAPGVAVKAGTELRILPLGDSITWGFPPDTNANAYRLELLNDLSADNVVYAGTQPHGTFSDNWNEGYPGQTIQYINDHCDAALSQNPNIVLLMAGTNDMNPDPNISVQGDDPTQASQRLGVLIDKINSQLPNTTVLVAQLPGDNDSQQHQQNTDAFNALIPDVVNARLDSGFYVAVVNMKSVAGSLIRANDVHPTDQGYNMLGDLWYDALHQIPSDWIQPPIGADPDRSSSNPSSGGSGADSSARGSNITANGGPDPAIPAPDYGVSPVQPEGKSTIANAASSASQGGTKHCLDTPVFNEAGEIALGLGQTGAWHYYKNWVEAGKVADGLHLDPQWVSLYDMNGDGKADYLWVDPVSGELTCWLNNLPNPWSPAGNGQVGTGIIASGTGVGAASVFFADMNGDGLADYLVVNGDTGHVDVYWNAGPDDSADNGWRFNPGGQLASGVPHANLETLRFPDINGDGRADYVIIGEGGSLGVFLNYGQPGSYDVLFAAQGGIATGAESNFSRLSLEDIDGDGRADYLMFGGNGSLTGFLNQPTQREGVPLYINQGADDPTVLADGIGQDPSVIRLADLDGDGKKDYCYIDQDGAIWLWYNRGTADTSMAMDGLRLADMDGDGKDDYVYLDAATGAPTLYYTAGPSDGDSLGFQFYPADPPVIASGAAPAANVQLADMNGDGKADYVVVDPVTGALNLYLNGGRDTTAVNNWRFVPIGTIATGLGPGKNTRLADIDGDGRADYIQLGPHGEATIYRNVFPRDPSLQYDFERLEQADASGIGQIPGDISFHDVNGDNKADYIFTNHFDGTSYAYINNYPNSPQWLPPNGPLHGYLAQSNNPDQGLSGRTVRYGKMLGTNRADYLAVNPNTGALAAWFNQCNDQDSNPPCKAPLIPAGSGQFYFWEQYQSSSTSAKAYGITNVNNWNANYVKGQGQPNTQDPGVANPVFSINGGGECAQAGTMTFSKTCGTSAGYNDTNWNVAGFQTGVANCVSAQHAPSLESGSDTLWIPALLCTGSICA